MINEEIIKINIQVYEKDSEVCYFVYDEKGYGQEYSGVTLEWLVNYLETVFRCSENVRGKKLIPHGLQEK